MINEYIKGFLQCLPLDSVASIPTSSSCEYTVHVSATVEDGRISSWMEISSFYQSF